MDPSSGGSIWPDPERFEVIRRESRALRQWSAEVRVRARAGRAQARRGRSRREILRDSAFARLRARQATMPAIEQAKGIIMAQQRCGPDEAFDLLRRVSQRTNVKVHVMAAQIVEHIAADSDASNVTPISLGAARSRQARTRPGHESVSPPRAKSFRPVLDYRTDVPGRADSGPGCSGLTDYWHG